MEELLNFLIEGSATDDDFVETTAECLLDLSTNLFTNLLRNQRSLEEDLHGWCVKLWQHFLPDDLLDDQRHSDDDDRLDFGKCLSDNGWRRNACEEEDVATGCKLLDELECHAVHVSHWQYADGVVAGMQTPVKYLVGKEQVAPHGAVRNHYALGEASCARCVVDKSQFIGILFLVVVHHFLAEILRELLSEQQVEVFPCVCELFGTGNHEGIVRNVDDSENVGHLFRVNLSRYDITHEE